MNARIITFIISRLFALYLLIMYVLNFAVQFATAVVLRHTIGAESMWEYVGSTGLATSLYAFAAAILWFGASWLSRSIAKPFPEKFAGDMSFGHWQALVIVAVGWYAILMALGVFGDIFKIAGPYQSDSDTLTPLWKESALYMAVGILLIVLPRKIVSGLNALRAWGNKPFIAREDQ